MYLLILSAPCFCFFLCVAWRLFARNPVRRTLQDCSAQTEETHQELCDSAISILAGDEVDKGHSEEVPVQDMQYRSVKTSLQQVFACAYSQFLFGPEVLGPMDKQPLYKALWQELDLATDRIMGTACALDIAAVSTGCIHILTRHLHHMKEGSRELLFSSWENEVAFLRVCSEALVQNFLPESMWKLDLYRCVLKEIVAFKVLQQLVTCLSDPNTLNQLLVRYLDVATPCSSTEEPEGEGTETAQPEDDRGLQTTGSTGTTDNSDNKANRKGKTTKVSRGNIFKKFLGKFLKRTKKFKGKNKETETGPSFRALELQNLSDEEDDDSLCSSISEYMLLNSNQNMMYNLLKELWRDGQWMVTVPQVQERNKELVFTIHLEEQNSPENLHWDVRLSETQLQVLKVLQDSTHLLPLPDMLESTDKFKDEARVKLENFLQSEVGQSQEVFQLLFNPFCDSLCDLLDNLPSLFSSTLDDEESISHMKTDQDGNRRRPRRSPEPPSESTGTCEDEGVQKDYEYAKKVPNVDPSISRSDTSSNQFIHDSSGSACTLDQLAKRSTSEPGESGKEQPPDQPTGHPANQSTDLTPDWCPNQDTDQPLDQLANRGIDQNGNQGTEQPVKQGIHQCAKQGTDQPVKQGIHQCAKQGTDQPADGDTEQPAVVPTPLLCSLSQDEGSKTNEKSSASANMSVDISGKEAKEQGAKREEKAASQRRSVDELMKALMDLLKEIFSNSWSLLTLTRTLSTMLKPLVLKELTSVLDNLKLTDAQVASHLDSLRETLWPKGIPAVWGSPPTSEEKNETKEKACSLLIAKSPWILKSNVKSAFELLQDTQENKKLVYTLLSLLLRKLFPGDRELHSMAGELLKNPL